MTSFIHIEMTSKSEILELAAEYYQDYCTGGALHIVLDDGNIEDEHIEWCIKEAKIAGDKEAVELGEALLTLTIKQRYEIRECYPYSGHEDDVWMEDEIKQLKAERGYYREQLLWRLKGDMVGHDIEGYLDDRCARTLEKKKTCPECASKDIHFYEMEGVRFISEKDPTSTTRFKYQCLSCKHRWVRVEKK